MISIDQGQIKAKRKRWWMIQSAAATSISQRHKLTAPVFNVN
jgi:hypothetical protein